VSVSFSERNLVVELDNGRSTPLSWYPRLRLASEDARMNYEISPLGVHWLELDEDLSVAGMLAGRRSR
jgi:hypothetical protein